MLACSDRTALGPCSLGWNTGWPLQAAEGGEDGMPCCGVNRGPPKSCPPTTWEQDTVQAGLCRYGWSRQGDLGGGQGLRGKLAGVLREVWTQTHRVTTAGCPRQWRDVATGPGAPRTAGHKWAHVRGAPGQTAPNPRVRCGGLPEWGSAQLPPGPRPPSLQLSFAPGYLCPKMPSG